MTPVTQSLRGPGVAIFSDDTSSRPEISRDLQSHLASAVYPTGDFEELDHLLSDGTLEAVVCVDGDADGKFRLVDEVLTRVAGRIPVLLIAPDHCQSAIAEGFRGGTCEAVLSDGVSIEEIAESIERLRKPEGGNAAVNNHGRESRFLPAEAFLQKLEDDLLQSMGGIAVLAIQIVEVGYFARKFGAAAIHDLTRELAKRLLLAIPDSGFFCRRPDSTFLVAINPVTTSAALETRISQISDELGFLASIGDLEFRIESVIGACDPSIIVEAKSAVEHADASLKNAVAKQLSYHIAGPDIDGLTLRYSLNRRSNRKSERRGGERKPVYKKAKFFLDHLNASVDCIVLDLSRGGARLRVSDSLVLPEEFELLLSYHGERQRVRLRWRRQKEVGVEFVKPQSG